MLKLFNLGRLSSHEDFNLTLLVGEMDEKGDVATVLSHLLGHEYEKIRVGGLGACSRNFRWKKWALSSRREPVHSVQNIHVRMYQHPGAAARFFSF